MKHRGHHGYTGEIPQLDQIMNRQGKYMSWTYKFFIRPIHLFINQPSSSNQNSA